MLPFCGYHMGDYFKHWLEMGEALGAQAPRIFCVNWFRKDEHGNWLWPGFGENSRVLKWICERIEGKADAVETPIGLVPTPDSLDLDGLDIPSSHMEELLSVRVQDWQPEVPQIREFYGQFGDRLPQALMVELDAFEKRLNK
jgi:phosphoenolpyruvate carboxykinase (GTP)